MSIPSIIATVIILAICAVVAFFVVNLRLSDKYAEKQECRQKIEPSFSILFFHR